MRCWRLGYGGGFYDRSIASLRNSGHEVVAIGIAFAGQQVDKVPTGPYDMALDAVWTPVSPNLTVCKSGARSAGSK